MDSSTLPLILAGPIVRRTTKNKIWFWIAWREEITKCQVSIVNYHTIRKKSPHYVEKNVLVEVTDFHTVRLGHRIWMALFSITCMEKSNEFPENQILGYDIIIHYKHEDEEKSTSISSLNLAINYPPFPLPTIVIGNNRKLVHGSCRRPGAQGTDAFDALDKWLSDNISSTAKRPPSLILTGDQIYADDVAEQLFHSIRKLSRDIFGYDEAIPFDSNRGGIEFVSTDKLPYGRFSNRGRKDLTSGESNKTKFTTQDGEGHLLSFPEYASMYLLVWNPDLCKMYYVDSEVFLDIGHHVRGRNISQTINLMYFSESVKACRRVMANCATYMIFDDHEVTDDWNASKEWESGTKSRAISKRIIANALCAYWCFQGWGNAPKKFDKQFRKTISDHLYFLMEKEGEPNIPSSTNYDKMLLAAYWSFVAPTYPKAVCIDTRTRHAYEDETGPPTLINDDAMRYITQEIEYYGFEKGNIMLIVVPSPFLNNRILLGGQDLAIGFGGKPVDYDYELWDNNSAQRGNFIGTLYEKFQPSSIVFFSGDVHFASVIAGRYAWHMDEKETVNGRAKWSIRVIQITSSPIKNVNKNFSERFGPFSSTSSVGQKIYALYEFRKGKTQNGGTMMMHASATKIPGDLSSGTYIFQNNFCIVTMPSKPQQKVSAMFIGIEDYFPPPQYYGYWYSQLKKSKTRSPGKILTSVTTIDTKNDPSLFRIISNMNNMPMNP